ncbi:MAG: class I SAM-dependent methyltransferase [Pseudomonadales bacterium]|nr:class I SAM-dependent methyltransferase [Pseudomonadales bacterium]
MTRPVCGTETDRDAPALGDLRLPSLERRLRQGRRLPLARACGAGPGVHVHDALAGWGTDGLVLAMLGCVVHMSERQPSIHRILARRLERYDGETTVACHLEDARDRWREGGSFDVIYLDPMFGEHPKTALPAKHMQVLAELADTFDDDEVTRLIDQARAAASSRVVVKRRASAAPLGRTAWSVAGRTVRYDVYAG